MADDRLKELQELERDVRGFRAALDPDSPFHAAAFKLEALCGKAEAVLTAPADDYFDPNELESPDQETGEGLWNDDAPQCWWNIAIKRGAKVVDGTIDGAEFARVGVALINSCINCGETVAPYNSYQVAPDNPYAYCAQCAGVEDGS
jgi:hypothetical protein